MIADYLPEGAERTVKMIKEAGGKASCIAADVSVTRQVEMMVDKTVATYGRLDCAFNNAALRARRSTPLSILKKSSIGLSPINLKGVWLCMKYEIPQMLKSGRGAIVNTASCGTGRGCPAFRVQC